MLKKFSKILPFVLAIIVLAGCGSSRFSSKHYRNREYVKVEPVEVAEKKAERRVYSNTEIETVESASEVSIVLNNEAPNDGVAAENVKGNTASASNAKTQEKAEKSKKDTKPFVAEKNAARKIQGKIEKVVSLPSSEGTTADQILLIILAILLPPLAVYLKDGSATTLFWITLILCLLGGGFFFGWGGYFGGAWFIAFLLALLRVLDVI